MGRHTPIAVGGINMLAMVSRHSDTPWREVIGWNASELDAMEAKYAEDETEWRNKEMNELENAEIEKVEAAWFVVDWPQHVLTPRYNSDAIYHGPMTEAEARAFNGGIEVYGE